MLVLFLILAIGLGLGKLTLRGVSLGSAGVLFAAMLFGHLGFSIPKGVMDLGLLLFVYAVGLQAGPRFFRTFRRHGMQYVILGLVTAGTGALLTLGMARILQLPYELASGLYTGALTCTPALAAAIEAVERLAPGTSSTVSVGYGIAYPFSMVGIVLLMQFLPALLRRDIRKEEQRWQQEKQLETPALHTRQFLISNPNLDGKRVSEINPNRMTLANISRVKRCEEVFAATPDLVLKQGDVVMVVGPEAELEKMRLLLGEERHERMDVNANVLSIDVDVTEPSLTGKTLAEMKAWERYTVVITRIRRLGQELAPSGSATLEMGDNIRVVGDRQAVEAFIKLVHGSEKHADETNLLPFLIGLLLGVALGSIPINLPGTAGTPGIQVKLGAAGGAFLVSLLVGHFGGIPLGKGARWGRLYVPRAARILSRELGLILFLAGAGINAGAHFLEILQEQGVEILLAGVLVTSGTAAAGLLTMHLGYRMNMLSTMGSLCACMTNPPGLSAASNQTETDLPTIAYASVYPAALIFKILLAQVLVSVLQRIL
jgi:putative transport protein